MVFWLLRGMQIFLSTREGNAAKGFSISSSVRHRLAAYLAHRGPYSAATLRTGVLHGFNSQSLIGGPLP